MVCGAPEAAVHQVSVQVIVMLAVAFPSTRWTTVTSPAAIHTLARARHAAVGHEASEGARDIRRWVGVRSV